MSTPSASTHTQILDPTQLTRRKASPNLFSSMKGLIKLRSRHHIETSLFSSDALPGRSIDSTHRPRQRFRSPVPQSSARSWVPSLRKRSSRRQHVPSMIDYLTLAQLENVWYSQDSCRGCVRANQIAVRPEVQLQSQQHSSRRSDELFLPQSPRCPPNMRAERRSFDGSVRSRPPSYQA